MRRLKPENLHVTLPLISLVCVVVALISVVMAWFSMSINPNVNDISLYIQRERNNADLAIFFNGQPIGDKDLSQLSPIPGDDITFIISNIRNVEDSVTSFNVSLEELKGDELKILKSGTDYYSMLDMFALYTAYERDYSEIGNGSGLTYTSAGALSGYINNKVIMSADREDGKFGTIIFRLVLTLAEGVDNSNINELQGKSFSFENIMLSPGGGG